MCSGQEGCESDHCLGPCYFLLTKKEQQYADDGHHCRELADGARNALEIFLVQDFESASTLYLQTVSNFTMKMRMEPVRAGCTRIQVRDAEVAEIDDHSQRSPLRPAGCTWRTQGRTSSAGCTRAPCARTHDVTVHAVCTMGPGRAPSLGQFETVVSG